jgi:hypothetical protein
MAKELTPEEITRIQQQQAQEHVKHGGKLDTDETVNDNKKWARAGTTGHKGRKIGKG